LDSWLVDQAVAAGVQVDENARVVDAIVEHRESRRAPDVRGVRVEQHGRTCAVKAAVTIAADGRHSPLAFGLGLARHPAAPRRWAIGAYFDGVAGLSRMGEMHVRRGCYIGVAPVPSGLANVCVVTADRTALRDHARLLAGAVQRDWLLADRFRRARLVTPPSCIGPLAAECVHPGMAGLLLAGDAAGFIDPMTGDGVHFAIRGGELAAAAVLGGPAGAPHLHEQLERMRRRAFRAKWRFNRALRRLVAVPPAIDAASLAASLAPALLQRAIAFAGDVPAAVSS
jgi:flavin-dependent dehydrogenase